MIYEYILSWNGHAVTRQHDAERPQTAQIEATNVFAGIVKCFHTHAHTYAGIVGHTLERDRFLFLGTTAALGLAISAHRTQATGRGPHSNTRSRHVI